MLRRWVRKLRANPLLVVALVGLAAAGAYAWTQVKPFLIHPNDHVHATIPDAPKLTASDGETLYRVDATLSEARYRVGETFVGQSAGEATGATRGIAGDIALNRTDPAASRVGDIVVDLHQLTSDDSLRDARIRHDYLSSHEFALAHLTDARLTGLPGAIEPGESYDFTLTGDLRVKETARPVTFDVTGTLIGDELRLSAAATILMSDYDVGPISVAGLVKTDDEVALTLELIAADPSSRSIPDELTQPEAEEDSGGGPSFRNEVMPVLAENCASCHNPGQLGAADFRLETAGDAAKFADGLAMVTRTGYMPPWPASDEGIALRHNRELDPTEIEAIKAWAAAGGPLDTDEDAEITAPPDERRDLREDETLALPEPYEGTGELDDDYRCFVMDPGFDEPTFMTGYSFRPEERRVTHHALVYKVAAQAREQAAGLDGSDGRPGWSCYVGTGLSASPGLGGQGGREASSLVAGWVPGQVPLDFGDDAGFRFEPGEFLVAQIHYHYDDGTYPDQSKLVLQTEPGDAGLRELTVRNPIAPVEVPCPAGDDEAPLCDRGAAQERISDLYGPVAGAIPGGALRMCDASPEDYADQTGQVGSTSCDRQVGQDGHIVDVLGHMHELGASFRMTLNPGTPEEVVLLDIPTWNFDWQLNYQPVDPVPVSADDTLRIECSWDRSLRHDPEPRYLLFAEGTEDEMCFSTYTVLPALIDGQR